MSIFGFRKKYRLISRVRTTIKILFKHGLGYFIDRIFKDPSLRIFRLPGSRKYERFSPGHRLRLVLEELGPTYIKIGQFFSTRADILPEDILKELEKLQDSVSPFNFDTVKKTFNEDFGTNIEDIFETFSEKPIFSASIGQVHLASLKSHQNCVVKIRRPKIEEIVSADIEVLKEITRLASKHIPEIKQWNISGLLEDVGEHLKRQMDFIYEAGMMEKLKTFYKKVNIKVPDIFWEYTSKRVITMEQIQGTKISDSANVNVNVPEDLVKGLFQVLFETGYFHGDLHPGNIIITEKGEIALVDFGLVGYLSFEERKQLAGILSGVLSGKITEALPHMKNFFGLSYRVPESFERDVNFIIDKYGSLPLKKLHLADIVYDLMKIARKMNVRLNPDIGLLAKNLLSLESICATINPSESLLNLSKAYWQPLIKKGFLHYIWIEDIKNVFQSYSTLIKRIPEDIEEFVQMNRERVETERQIATRIERYTKSLEQAGTKISISILMLPVVSTLIIIGIKNFSPVFFMISLVLLVLFIIIMFRLSGSRND